MVKMCLAHSDEITFIEAIQIILEDPDLELCTSRDELSGEHNSICVSDFDESYDNCGNMPGKLRWHTKNDPKPHIDDYLLQVLKKRMNKNCICETKRVH